MTTIPGNLVVALSRSYRLERELGAGGMATVYLAQDLKHDRKVAIKVLRPELAAVIGAERFLSEIKTTANLQHPNILPLFDSGATSPRRHDATGGESGPAAEATWRHGDVFLYYVMPFIEGESLRDRLTREKQLPIPDAVRIATEVAGALDYAHRHNVIHRDIKPENILLHDGRALVADFGIALAASKAGGGRMTETGMSLGTPTYMSPEQAMGEREITARSDVYALGAMTYEMLLGEPPFTGPTAQSIVAKVMTEKPAPLIGRRDRIPPAVEDAVLTALEKLPADRFASAAEFAAALTGGATSSGRQVATAMRGRQNVATWRRGALSVLAAAITFVAGTKFGGRRTTAGRGDPIRATLFLGDSAGIRAVANLRLAISPSGTQVAYVGPAGSDVMLWVRNLDQPTAQPLQETRGAFAPFYSPDGQTIGFFTAANGQTELRLIPAAGGVPRTVVAGGVAPYGGGDWGDDGRIYFVNDGRTLSRVAAEGGPVTRISRIDSASNVREHDFPDVLPGSRRALVMLWRGSPGLNHIGLMELATGAVTDLAPGTFARFVAPDFLAIGSSDGRVVGVRFDPVTGNLIGSPVPMLQDIQGESGNGTLQFAVSTNGTLVYQRGTGGTTQPVWVDRAGRQTLVDSALTGAFQQLALSPDASRIVLDRAESGESQIWVKQLSTGTFTRLSLGVSGADRPVWSPDGRRVAFLATRNERRTAWIQRADGSDTVEPAIPGEPRLDEIGFDPLGRYILLRSEGSGIGSRYLMAFRPGVDSVPRTLLRSGGDNFAMTLSPDGQWLAHVSSESGVSEVYVRPFPNVDSARFAISVGGGIEPLWRRDGKELFFRNTRGGVFAVPVTIGRHFEHGSPQLLFTSNDISFQEFYRSYDIHPDGKRFLMLHTGGVSTTELNVVLNWRTELERFSRVPP